SHECDGPVADLGFARELRFLDIGHPDKIHVPATINIGFRERRKLRALYAQISTPAFDGNIHLFAGLFDDRRKPRTNGVRESDMRHDTLAEKCRDARLRAIVE